MVKNSEKTYGQIVTELKSMTDRQEVGETVPEIGKTFSKIFEECFTLAKKHNIVKDFYIWVRVQSDPNNSQMMRLYPQMRHTRPSPYQTQDHYLWQCNATTGKIDFQWCIPKKEVTGNVLNRPHQYHPQWVEILTAYQKGELI